MGEIIQGRHYSPHNYKTLWLVKTLSKCGFLVLELAQQHTCKICSFLLKPLILATPVEAF